MPSDYPPSTHLLRDLAFELDRTGEGLVVRAPVVPDLQGDDGAVRAGVLGTLMDVFGGNLSIEAALPDWAVTSELELHVLRAVRKGPLVVQGHPLRAGRTSVVLDVVLLDGEGERAAVGNMSFTKIERRDASPALPMHRPAVTSLALPDSGFRVPFLEAIGIRGVDGNPAAVELDLVPYVQNSVGALQGGLVTTMVEVAAERAARHALGRSVVTTDFSVHFLALGKVGPLRASASLLRAEENGALLRVEVRDRGDGDRLLSVASARTGHP